MNVELLAIQPGKTDKTEIVEHAARVCYRSEMAGSKEKRRRFLLRLAERQHLSVFEHARYVGLYKGGSPYHMYWPMRYGMNVTQQESELFVVSMNARNGIEMIGKNPLFDPESLGLEFLQYGDLSDEEKACHASATFEISGVSRACGNQIERHRVASYSQESMRYVDMDGQKVVEPWTVHANSVAMDQYRRAVLGAFRAYKAMRDVGIPKEDARYVLPIGTQTTIVMTCNFREWRHFIKLRTSKHAQWEIRAIANAVLDILYNQTPVIFEDLIK